VPKISRPKGSAKLKNKNHAVKYPVNI